MQPDNDNQPTKSDLREVIEEFKTYIAERELKALRWTFGLLTFYFFGTLATLWVLHEDLIRLRNDTKELRTEVQQLTRK
jgi:hypothetical protein